MPEKIGAPDRIRTCDPCLRRAVLYPAELRVRRFGPVSSAFPEAPVSFAWLCLIHPTQGEHAPRSQNQSALENSHGPRRPREKQRQDHVNPRLRQIMNIARKIPSAARASC